MISVEPAALLARIQRKCSIRESLPDRGTAGDHISRGKSRGSVFTLHLHIAVANGSSNNSGNNITNINTSSDSRINNSNNNLFHSFPAVRWAGIYTIRSLEYYGLNSMYLPNGSGRECTAVVRLTRRDCETVMIAYNNPVYIWLRFAHVQIKVT